MKETEKKKKKAENSHRQIQRPFKVGMSEEQTSGWAFAEACLQHAEEKNKVKSTIVGSTHYLYYVREVTTSKLLFTHYKICIIKSNFKVCMLILISVNKALGIY